MITKEQKIRMGIFMTVATAALIALMAVFIAPHLKEEGDIYYINFREMSVNGLNVSADVKYQGVKIGSVERISVKPDDLNSILVRVLIEKGFPVKEEMRAALQYAGITGLRFVEISGGDNNSRPVPPGGEILTQKGLGEKAEDIVLNIDSVVDAINKMLSPENRENIASLIKNMEKSTRVMSEVLTKRQKNVDQVIGKFDTAMTEIIGLSKNLKEFSQHLNRLQETLELDQVSLEMRNVLRTVSHRLSGEDMDRLVDNMGRFVGNADAVLGRLEKSIYRSEEEFKKTLSDFRESMENISKFTRDLREDPTLLIRKRAAKGRKR